MLYGSQIAFVIGVAALSCGAAATVYDCFREGGYLYSLINKPPKNLQLTNQTSTDSLPTSLDSSKEPKQKSSGNSSGGGGDSLSIGTTLSSGGNSTVITTSGKGKGGSEGLVLKT